jgi:hypothetical protein
MRGSAMALINRHQWNSSPLILKHRLEKIPAAKSLKKCRFEDV